jgi:hypothetical protein
MLLLALFWLHIILRVAADVDTKTVSIQSAAGYLVARACVQGCLWTGDLEIIYEIGCPRPYYNQCYCNLDQASSATSFLSSSCIPTSCSDNGPDVATAVSLYMNYCSGAGYPFQGSNIAVQTSTQTEGSPNVVTATRSSVVTATATSTTDQPSSAGRSTSFPTVVGLLMALLWPATATVWIVEASTAWTTETPTGTAAARVGGGGGGYSTSDKIALGVGIGIGLPAALSGIALCWWTMIKGA